MTRKSPTLSLERPASEETFTRSRSIHRPRGFTYLERFMVEVPPLASAPWN